MCNQSFVILMEVMGDGDGYGDSVDGRGGEDGDGRGFGDAMVVAISQISLFLLDKRLKPSVNLTVLFYCRHI